MLTFIRLSAFVCCVKLLARTAPHLDRFVTWVANRYPGRVKATRLQVPIDLGLHHLFSLPHRCTVESDEIYEAREKVRRHFSIRTGIGQKKTRKGFEEGAEHIGQFNFFVNARLLCTRVRGVG